MNEQDEKVSLRGVNLGNWLMMEMWMFGNDQVFGQGIVDQCTFEDALVARFGEAEKDRLFKVHRDSWMTEKDWDFMEDAGFNVVRIPFPYDLIEDDDNPKTLKPDAWHYLDWSIAEAKERKMYVILDLHGAAGRQGWEHHTGCAGKNELWGSQTYRDRTIWLWEQIAQKYKDEDAIAGYGLLNEAWGASPKVMSEFGIDLYHAVRRYDNEHIVILPGHSEDGGFTVYGDPLDSGMENVAFEMHYYPGIFGWGDIGYKTHRDWLDCGVSGVDGICSVAKRSQDAYTPLLIGE
ncbi:MAG: endoglucanase, partial [Alphaproteobacteria bacterium]|nr:endoglucanase [Alphaproteobacteria bacterium]